jgi:hypothetical protein
MEVFYYFLALFIVSFNKFNFKLMAIQKLLKIKKVNEFEKLGMVQRFRLQHNIFPNKYYYKLIKKATPMLKN